jgi:RHS repeat-associated protein
MGRVSSIAWNATGATLQTPGGRQATVVNDSVGRVATFTSGGSTWSYSYATNSTWFITSVTDPLGQTRTTTTDTNLGRPISLPDSAAGTISLSYDQSGNLATATYPEGNGTSYTRDSRSNITGVTLNPKPGSSQSAVATTSGFDTSCTTPSCNKPNWTKDAKGNQTDYTYDPVHGGVLTETLPAAAVGGIRPQTRYSYAQVPTYAKSSTGALTQIGSIWTTTGVSTCATAAACAGTADETKTVLSYAGSNNLQPISITVQAGDGSVVSTETRSYDPNGDVLTVDGPLSGTGDTTTYRYDADRETVGVISPDPDGVGPRKQHAMRTTYNADGQPTLVEVGTVTGTDDTAWAAFSSQQQMATTYDSSGRKTADMVTAGGTTYGLTQLSYDGNGRLDCSAQRMNPNLWGSPPPSACTAQMAGTAGPDRITKYGYDAIGRRTSVITGYGTSSPVSNVTTTYTANGKTASEADGNGNVTSYAYDGLDRLVTTTYPGGSYEQSGYDANGSLTSQRLRDGTSITYAFDNRGRLVSKALPNGETGASYSYDLLDRVQSVTQGTTISYVWDPLSRLKSETQPFGSMAYQYDAGGNRTRLTWPDGFYVDYSYDIASELSAIRDNAAANLATFTYDDLGRRLSLTRGNGVATTYSYDPVSRLNGLNNDLSGTGDDQNATFTHNPASQIASVTRPNTSYNYTNSVNTNRTYAVNALNQYTSASSSAGTTSFSYDARGNLITSGASTYGYTSENLLKTAPSGISLYYDPTGRLSEYDTSVSTRFVYDADQIVAEVANPTGAIQKRYVFGPGADEPLVEYDASGAKTYLVADERGSIVARTDASGSASVKNTYDEYGIPGANNQGRFQYTGQAWLNDLGMFYYKARIYSPTLGRFLQTDPLGYADGLNWYDYVHADPINGVDSTGLLQDICVMVPVGGIHSIQRKKRGS